MRCSGTSPRRSASATSACRFRPRGMRRRAGCRPLRGLPARDRRRSQVSAKAMASRSSRAPPNVLRRVFHRLRTALASQRALGELANECSASSRPSDRRTRQVKRPIWPKLAREDRMRPTSDAWRMWAKGSFPAKLPKKDWSARRACGSRSDRSRRSGRPPSDRGRRDRSPRGEVGKQPGAAQAIWTGR